jgi:hypothetical protein
VHGYQRACEYRPSFSDRFGSIEDAGAQLSLLKNVFGLQFADAREAASKLWLELVSSRLDWYATNLTEA